MKIFLPLIQSVIFAAVLRRVERQCAPRLPAKGERSPDGLKMPSKNAA